MSRAKTSAVRPTGGSGKVSKSASSAWKDRIAPEDYEELKNTFEVFDEDHSGTIDPAEISAVLEKLGTQGRSPYVLGLIYSLQEKGKPIGFEEFVEICGNRIGETKTRDGLRRVFTLIDKDENGILDIDEFRSLSKYLKDNLNDDDVLEMMHSCHVNKKTSTNEGFTFDEFYQIVTSFHANK